MQFNFSRFNLYLLSCICLVHAGKKYDRNKHMKFRIVDNPHTLYERDHVSHSSAVLQRTGDGTRSVVDTCFFSAFDILNCKSIVHFYVTRDVVVPILA